MAAVDPLSPLLDCAGPFTDAGLMDLPWSSLLGLPHRFSAIAAHVPPSEPHGTFAHDERPWCVVSREF